MKKKQKKVVVDRRFMTELARHIYDSKRRKFLRLCDGKLQNGPDPTDEERPMHCGLGELYLEMTGRQPEVDGVDESDVVDLAVELSSLPSPESLGEEAVKRIRSLKLNDELEADLIVDIVRRHKSSFRVAAEADFRAALDGIPSTNDDYCGNSCSDETFRTRSKRVAAQLRKAAKFLPK